MKRSWVEISLPRLRRNLAALRQHLAPATAMMAVVKANAYGHGASAVSRELSRNGVQQFAVANLQEAIEVRQSAPRAEILVLGGCQAGEEQEFGKYDLTAAVFDRRPLPEDLKVEIKIDTGMTRLGIPWTEIARCLENQKGRIRGVYSHFADADGDIQFTDLQLDRFLEATEGLPYRRHICASTALTLTRGHLDMVRLGLSLFGICSLPEVDYIEPILSWKTLVLTILDVPVGRDIGYGRTFSTSRPSRVGVLSVGYADGYRRNLSGRGQVRIQGRLHPIVGRVSMDLTSVDLTDAPEVQVGEEVTILEADADSPISAAGLARMLGTIPYEILTTIGSRVERTYFE
ncbi:MAG: alanine racemase [Acidobacteriota bacterium]